MCVLSFLAHERVNGFDGSAALVAAPEIGPFAVVGAEPCTEFSLQGLYHLVEGLAHRRSSGPSGPRPRRHERRDDPPFRIGQVASTTQMIAGMLPPGGQRPHETLQTGSDNRLDSHLRRTIHPPFAEFRDSVPDVQG